MRRQIEVKTATGSTIFDASAWDCCIRKMMIAVAVLCIAMLCCAIRFEKLAHLKRGKAIPRQDLLDGLGGSNAKANADETVVPFEQLPETDFANGVRLIRIGGNLRESAEFIAWMLQFGWEQYSEEIREDLQVIASQVYHSDEMKRIFLIPFDISWFQKLPLIFGREFGLADIKRDLDDERTITNSLFHQIALDESISTEFRVNIDNQDSRLVGHIESIKKSCAHFFGGLWDVMGTVGYPMDDLNPEIVVKTQHLFFQVEDQIFGSVQSTIDAIRDAVARLGERYSQVPHIEQLQQSLTAYVLKLEQLMHLPSLASIHEARNALGSAPADQVQEYFKNSFSSIFKFTFAMN